jgi:hypothetical protein
VLDGFRVSVGTRTIEEDVWPPKKAASLVKLLALAAGHRLQREQIMDLLWPELDLHPPKQLGVSGRKATGRKGRSLVELPSLFYVLETHAFVFWLWQVAVRLPLLMEERRKSTLIPAHRSQKAGSKTLLVYIRVCSVHSIVVLLST